MIAQFVDQNHRQWNKHIAALQYVYNSVAHDATGHSPTYLNYGRELAAPNPTDRTRFHVPVCTDAWLHHLLDVQELVVTNLARAFQ